jgi:thymidine kinase
MFLENNITEVRKRGWIEVICGSMFSGKTEELIRRIRRAVYAKQKVEIFKPEIDVRYDVEKVVSHNENAINSIPIQNSSQILLMLNDAEVVGIDEAQFFDTELVNVCNELASRGIRVIVAGLDMDYLGKPFGPMPQLLAVAEYVTKVHAICLGCGGLAYVSHRKIHNDKLVLLGETDSYEPLCRHCQNEKMKDSQK